jgi:outer membrane protein, heavy metal efflux system
MRGISARPLVFRAPIAAPLLCAACAFGTWQGRAHAQALGELEGTARVCSAGPGAAMAKAQRLTGAAYVTAADASSNPALVVEHQRALDGPTDRESVAGVSLPLTLSGRQGLLRGAAAQRGTQAAAEADATLFETALSFRHAYARAVLDRARAEVLARQQAMLEQLSGTVAGLARGGEAAGYDLLRQRMQTQLHRRALELAEARAGASLALLGTWLDGDVQPAAVEPFQLAGGRLPADVVGSAEHPALRQLNARTRASALEARAAGRQWLPELTLFAGYRGTDTGDDQSHGIALSLELPIALFDYGQGEAAHARAEQAHARASAELLQRKHAARLRAANAQLQALQASAAYAQAALSDAESVQDKARQLYAAGEATITELLEAFAQAEQARLASIDLAEEMAMTRLARMEAAGTQLDRKLDRLCGVAPRSQP